MNEGNYPRALPLCRVLRQRFGSSDVEIGLLVYSFGPDSDISNYLMCCYDVLCIHGPQRITTLVIILNFEIPNLNVSNTLVYDQIPAELMTFPSAEVCSIDL